MFREVHLVYEMSKPTASTSLLWNGKKPGQEGSKAYSPLAHATLGDHYTLQWMALLDPRSDLENSQRARFRRRWCHCILPLSRFRQSLIIHNQIAVTFHHNSIDLRYEVSVSRGWGSLTLREKVSLGDRHNTKAHI